MDCQQSCDQDKYEAAKVLLSQSKYSADEFEVAETLVLMSQQQPKGTKLTYETAVKLLAKNPQNRRRLTLKEYMEQHSDEKRASLIKYNPKMKRKFNSTCRPYKSIEEYRKIRNKNNRAAKSSRDKLKIRTHENQTKIEYFEMDNRYIREELRRTTDRISIYEL